MQAITKSGLRKEITAILENADLSEISAVKVRQLLEAKFKLDLTTLRPTIDEMIMEFVNSKCKSDESDDDSDANEDDDDGDGADDNKSEEDTKKTVLKRPPPTKRSATSDESDSESDDDNNSKPSKKSKLDKKKAKNEHDSDSDDRSSTKKSKKPAAKKPATKGKGNGFTRAYTLSPELAKVMGSESMARHEVVKKVWQIIKERNLYDPKNKQYAICDSELLTVIGVKRFRTFGMLKYLRDHFIVD